MSTTQRTGGRQRYMAAYAHQSHPHNKAEAIYRQASFDRSLDSVRYASNASQPSLSHSIATYTESTPCSVCRPDFGDYHQDMSHSDCGASFVSEVPPSFDDTSDIEGVGMVNNNSKPTLIKFVEPVVQRDRDQGQGQQHRLTGMKKKIQRKKAALDGEPDVHQLPVLGFADGRTRYAASGEDKDMLNFPGVPPREQLTMPHKQEQWNVDTINIALEDLVLDKGKARSTLTAADDAESRIRSMMAANMKGGAAAASVLEEAHQDERQSMLRQRALSLSSQKSAGSSAHRAPDACLPPLPPLPSPSTSASQDSIVSPSANGKVAGLQPSNDHPLAAATSCSTRNSAVPSNSSDTPDEDEKVFAFYLPSLSLSNYSHAEDQLGAAMGPRLSTCTSTKRLDSMTSSNHSSLRDLDPRVVIQRARMQPLSCGLDAELDDSATLASDSTSSLGGHHSAINPEDLPPLLSNHYLQGKVNPAEFERLNRLPERQQALAAAAAANAASHRLTHKHLSKHKKGAGAAAVNTCEPISILRAEAAFLKQDVKKEKKNRLWLGGNSSTNSSVSSRSHGAASSSSGLGGRGALHASVSDVSSVSEGHQRLRSFKSSIRLKNLK
ncbi:hypothetical protein NDA11_003305 [Ustilago hordei]|uniref:Uncharacterized protein n=1 Tax=Ustilago hordei TaxID=120017 RepID=I2G177_USTHO|nr:uncharacterized protein UHO2_03355 [Ustilago hordei]KAJ1040983.1 hypothetical protein NDA10_004797 [Ustilago hordei]KAJ1581236.1 hypothetical protein NDA15_007224 [Ustilago hordei]KAJ1582722.1 hypothetical protein NDA12_001693 [Ustilago hordei]KAJ1588650.1 hypothetical protein NDA11_003305 [Ustilago hordei]KAJ1599866.1 hypothetical protein NDA14_003891 [Ustilago hordei]